MAQFAAFMEELLNSLVNTAIHLFELVGVVVLIVAGVCGVVNYIRQDPMVRLKLAQGMALCLEFKLGSEILRTVVVRDLKEIAIVGAIIALRGAVTFLIHWESKNEKGESEAILEEKDRRKSLGEKPNQEETDK